MKKSEKEKNQITQVREYAGEVLTQNEIVADKMYWVLRIAVLLNVFMIFFPALNPARVSGLINKNVSLFTSAVSYNSLVAECTRAFDKGWLEPGSFVLLYVASILSVLGIALCCVTACMSLGNRKMKKFSNWFSIGGGALEIVGMFLILNVKETIANCTRPDKVMPMFRGTYWSFYVVLAIVILAYAAFIQLWIPKVEKGSKFAMLSKYKLFLMFMPFAALCFVFSYLPLFGWRYSFFDYTAGDTLSADKFVGFKWFTTLFRNPATRSDVFRVLRNTLAMSGLGLATSWCAMAFAIFLNEIKNPHIKRFVQTFTTIPNFISWVLVYAIALAIFSTDGFISSMMLNSGAWTQGKNFLMDSSHTWLKMLAWGMWKGIGWSAIIYIAGISGIDQQLYEAATVDGAGRFQKMWHITVPGLVPTFMVMLLMAIAGILSNGMDQYLVFENAVNKDVITVLDLYVYKLGIGDGQIPLSTVIGMMKSLISVILLFGANAVSKLIRGESIV